MQGETGPQGERGNDGAPGETGAPGAPVSIVKKNLQINVSAKKSDNRH